MVEKFDDILKRFRDGIPTATGKGETPSPVSLEERLKELVRDAREAGVLTQRKIDAFTKAIVDSAQRPRTVRCENAGKEGDVEVVWSFKEGKCEITSPAFPKSLWVVQDHYESMLLDRYEMKLSEFLKLMNLAYKFNGGVSFFQ